MINMGLAQAHPNYDDSEEGRAGPGELWLRLQLFFHLELFWSVYTSSYQDLHSDVAWTNGLVEVWSCSLYMCRWLQWLLQYRYCLAQQWIVWIVMVVYTTCLASHQVWRPWRELLLNFLNTSSTSQCPVKHRKTQTCRAAATCLKQREEIFNVLIYQLSYTLDITHYGNNKPKIIYMNVYEVEAKGGNTVLHVTNL